MVDRLVLVLILSSKLWEMGNASPLSFHIGRGSCITFGFFPCVIAATPRLCKGPSPLEWENRGFDSRCDGFFLRGSDSHRGKRENLSKQCC